MLQIEHLIKNYGDFHLDLSMKVLPGRITGLIGANGAGKSTTFKAALGLIFADGGSVQVLGKDVRERTEKDREALGVALSDSGFSGYLTVRNVCSILEKLYSGFDRSFFLKQAESFGLPLDKKIKEFSTGMKAKLKVLSAVSHKAKLLILDEPTAGLDVMARDEIYSLIREFMEKDEERGVLISSHISGDLETLCDDLYMLHKGQIILHEDVDVILDSYGLIKASAEEFQALDKAYILRSKKESYGYSALTNEKQYYMENYPHLAVEKGSIDEVIMLMAGGERI